MAAIQKYQTKKGSYRWRVRWTNEEGKQKSKSFDRQGYAKDYCIKLEHKMRNGTYIESSEVTMSTLLDDWFEIHQQGLAHNTILGYKYNIRHIKNKIGNIRLQNLKSSDINKMFKTLNLSGKYLQHIYSTLSLAIKYAIMDNLIDYNPMIQVKRPKKLKYQSNIVHPEKVKDYMMIYKDTWLYPAVCLSLFTGMRRGELLALQWSDINLKKMEITISKSIVLIGTDLTVKSTKTGDSRTVYIQPGLSIILNKHKKQQLKNKMLLGSDYHTSTYVITEDNGIRPRPDLLSTSFTRILKKSELPYVRFHDLRHTAGSLMIMAGVDLKTVSEFLGHSSITITADIYGHVIEDHKRKAANTLQKYLT